jgi:hypothetical protein
MKSQNTKKITHEFLMDPKTHTKFLNPKSDLMIQEKLKEATEKLQISNKTDVPNVTTKTARTTSYSSTTVNNQNTLINRNRKKLVNVVAPTNKVLTYGSSDNNNSSKAAGYDTKNTEGKTKNSFSHCSPKRIT